MDLTPESQRTKEYIEVLFGERSYPVMVSNTDIPSEFLPKFELKIQGKVRDIYLCEDTVVLVTTDRLSAFDRSVAVIPLKGRVLNLLSLWWFNHTKHIVPNYILSSPHPNVTVGKRCKVFPIEFVMRGYLTGSTATSLWTAYSKGSRHYCGHHLPDGLIKNQKLESNILTPTTKDEEHDALISADEILSRGLMTQAHWETCEKYAQELFALGQTVAHSKGLILVDTKYEFGVDGEGRVLLVDELHTPDSSRFWGAGSYEERFRNGEVT